MAGSERAGSGPASDSAFSQLQSGWGPGRELRLWSWPSAPSPWSRWPSQDSPMASRAGGSSRWLALHLSSALPSLLVRRYFPGKLPLGWLRVQRCLGERTCGVSVHWDSGEAPGGVGRPRSRPQGHSPTYRALLESARWLLTRGRAEEAKQPIQRVASVNKRKLLRAPEPGTCSSWASPALV